MSNINDIDVQKIKVIGFTKSELLHFKKTLRLAKRTFHPNVTSGLTLPEIIKTEAIDSAYSLKLYFLGLGFFFIGSLLTSSLKVAFLFSAIIIAAAVTHIFINAHEKSISLITEIKIIKLGIKLMF